ncbi:threonine--tRNA ligase [Aquella oligotrophica]|uniref:Threonine--tRNA ligase n=1 Tax=Aquella oligotrophica TaxID=2067065 RepID=A0A2I7N5S3_9NEIS|nr:threonine--tRNA ligase [Aquella oligotrophica]AUR51575.1 threonine--tRNA ligase [Aquella oligotrophica]
MLRITLPDGAVREFADSVTVLDVAKNISSGLAKATLAGVVDGKLVDASFTLTTDSKLQLVTDKDSEGLEVIRHSTAHLLAQAVKQLYPTAQVTIGPVIDNGFYYDFSFERTFTPEDLVAIEKKMANLVDQNIQVERVEMTREDAIKYFDSIGEKYKVEIISAIPAGEVISLYKQGDFIDLCRGPHVPSTSKLKAFKLMKVAGAYWRGDSNNEMLQRIYGTAWRNKDELKEYLHMLEEAEKRDHRKIGKQLDLFHLQEEAPGMVFWHPKGWAIWQTIEQYLRKELDKDGYKEIKTPQVVDKILWEKSGHMQNYGENMFLTSSENRDYAVKPMNCPCHVLVFNQGLKSYRDLPLRLAEFGSCHRNEPSGALHGIMRVRGFVQDDAHIFCTDEQIGSEAAKFIDLTYRVYQKFGFDKVDLKLSTRPEKRVGADELWDSAEAALAKALDDKGLPYTLQPGEGAFYGPKIEFALKDCLGREWQCGTLQLDFNLPERLGASYIAEDGSKKIPVMLHRAALGSLERFIGVLIEHYAGNLPFWLAPVQAVVLNISEKQNDYANKVYEALRDAGVRAEIDLSNEKIGYKIRQQSMQKVPYLLVIGDSEMQNNQVTVRKQDGTDLGAMTLDEFLLLDK